MKNLFFEFLSKYNALTSFNNNFRFTHCVDVYLATSTQGDNYSLNQIVMENCSQCGAECKSTGIGTGYGVDPKTNAKICYACCGVNDRKSLIDGEIGERFCFYYSNGMIVNWPNSLKIAPRYTRYSRHNWGLKRTDVWFSLEGHQFWGYIIGSNTEIIHIKKIKP
jgi:hypothetical protein